RPARVVVTRVPEHPAAAAPLVGPADLVADLRHAEDPPVERVVPEVLQPGAHAGRRVRRALADQPHALAHDRVGVLDRVAEAGDADVVAGGIDHRADVVEVRRQLLDALADVRVVLVEGRVAEEVGGHVPAARAQLLARALVYTPRALRSAIMPSKSRSVAGPWAPMASACSTRVG